MTACIFEVWVAWIGLGRPAKINDVPRRICTDFYTSVLGRRPLTAIVNNPTRCDPKPYTIKLTVVQEVAERPSSWPPSAPRAAHRPERPVLAVEEHGTARQQQRPLVVVVAVAAAADLAVAVGGLEDLEDLASLGQAVAVHRCLQEEEAAAAEALRDNHQDTP